MELFLIDAIGPFFRGYDRKTINWSKIPFSNIALESDPRQKQFEQIRQDMQQFTERVKSVGYNAVSLDDLAHLADHEWYEPEIRQQINAYQEEYLKIFQIIKAQDMGIYLTMDICSYTPALKGKLQNNFDKMLDFLSKLVDQFFIDFPQVDGLIMRIGESDGLDVTGAFKSELVLKTPSMVNQFLQILLPVFEKHKKRCILRTWTVGAYAIGDFIWHRKTFQKVLKNINSPALILSMKYGESDFFRFLNLNRAFFRTSIPKIIELQTRREYEGCGEYPSFIGWDYEHYARDLKQAPNMLGISVWCQTGGWVPFKRLAYIDVGSPWTEINSFVTLRIFRYQESVEQALKACFGDKKHAEYVTFFRLSDEVIKALLYTEEMARQKLYFRRVRIPPLLGVYWNNIFINHSMRKIMRYFIKDQEACIRDGYNALAKIKQMKKLAKELELPVDDIKYMHDTFKLLALARQYFFYPYDESVRKRLKTAKQKYKAAYPKNTRPRYRIKMDFEPFHLNSRLLHWSFNIILRRQRGYRLLDQLFTIYILSFIYRLIRTTRANWIPKFARKSAMGIDTVFK